MDCDTTIRSEDTIDLIIPNELLGKLPGKPKCSIPINDTYRIYYFDKNSVPKLSIETYTYSAIPKCFCLLDTSALEASGIYRLQTQPTLSLKGQGVIVGFIDSGIAYENLCFRNSDGSTRIRAIWDQGAEASDSGGASVYYGREYTKEEIDTALLSENPNELVPEKDELGHGTRLCSIACGSDGAAPFSDIIFVKLKPAKRYLKDFYYIPDETPVYQENDIMAAVAYLEDKAEEYNMPLVICLGLGTNNGSHSGTNILSEYLSEVGGLWGRCVVTATGNEAGERHHFFGEAEKGEVSVEINVEEDIPGFYAELWALAPELFSVEIRSPGGAYFTAGSARIGAHSEYNFTLEDTEVEVDYRTVGRTQGDQLIFIRFKRAVRGIWTVMVHPETTLNGNFHIWLPMTGCLKSDVFFLKPDPDVTLTVPSVAQAAIAVGGYLVSDGSLYRSSGCGYTASGQIKPTFLAPASVQAVGVRGESVTMTGTSAAAAITAGACAQLMEWGLVKRRDIALNSVEIANILIRGCTRETGVNYPDKARGYGKLDVYAALAKL